MGNPEEKNVSRNNGPSLADSNHSLASGEKTSHSGIYKIQHNSNQIHQIERELFIPKGSELPLCRQCASPLSFRLIEMVVYIAEDPDFQ